jgi:LSD1 subclass zinc finger protein
MTAPLCAAGCGQPSPAARLCKSCTASLRATLQLAATLEDDLADAAARLLRHGSGGPGGHRDEQPLLYDPAASAAAAALRRCLARWTGVIGAMEPKWAPAPGTVYGMAIWLAARTRWIRQHPAAGDLITGVRRAVDRCIGVLDAPPERHPAGQCGACGRPLLAPPGADTVTCVCGQSWEGITAARTARAAAADQVATATEISALLHAIGITVAPGTITSWGTRGSLSRRPGGKYALSEVMELIRRRDERKSRA